MHAHTHTLSNCLCQSLPALAAQALLKLFFCLRSARANDTQLPLLKTERQEEKEEREGTREQEGGEETNTPAALT